MANDNKSLRKLVDEYLSIELTEILDDETLTRLTSTEEMIKDKGLSARHVIKSLETTRNNIDSELKRLRRRKQAVTHTLDRLKDYVLWQMKRLGKDSFHNDICSITRVRNEAKKPKRYRLDCKVCGTVLADLYRVTGSSDPLCAPCADKRISDIVDEEIGYHLRIT